MTEILHNCNTQIKISNDIIEKKKHGLDCVADKYCQFADSYQNTLMVNNITETIAENLRNNTPHKKSIVRFTDHLCQEISLIEDIHYGALYNYYTISDAREIANTGWRVPSRSDDTIPMQNYIQSLNLTAGEGVLKEVGLTYWNSPTVGDNSFGFNARGHGERSDVNGSFSNLKQSGYFWLYDSSWWGGDVICEGFVNNSEVWLAWQFPSQSGLAIRLIKNSTTLTHGQSGIYVGNDGKLYRTICIDTQEYLADNLNETKYRNGDLIPVVTDNTTWVNLVTGAMCYYNNDINNA